MSGNPLSTEMITRFGVGALLRWNRPETGRFYHPKAVFRSLKLVPSRGIEPRFIE